MDTLLIIIIIVAVFVYIWYVMLVQKKNKTLESLSTIDVQLKQRLDLLPNVLAIAKKFMEHEKTLLNELTELRAGLMKSYNANNLDEVKQHIADAQKFSTQMDKFMLTVENYPNLKSDATMLQAMQTYNEVEAQIAAARRFYNSNVTELNNATQIFPGNVIANMVGIKAMPFFEAEPEARNTVDASKILG